MLLMLLFMFPYFECCKDTKTKLVRTMKMFANVIIGLVLVV